MSTPIHLDFRCRRCGSLTERVREKHSADLYAEQHETIYHACHDGGVGLTDLLGMHWPPGAEPSPEDRAEMGSPHRG